MVSHSIRNCHEWQVWSLLAINNNYHQILEITLRRSLYVELVAVARYSYCHLLPSSYYSGVHNRWTSLKRYFLFEVSCSRDIIVLRDLEFLLGPGATASDWIMVGLIGWVRERKSRPLTYNGETEIWGNGRQANGKVRKKEKQEKGKSEAGERGKLSDPPHERERGKPSESFTTVHRKPPTPFLILNKGWTGKFSGHPVFYLVL